MRTIRKEWKPNQAGAIAALLLVLLVAVLRGETLAQGRTVDSQAALDVAQLIKDLNSSDSRRERDAARRLSEMPTLPPEAIQPLADCLKTLLDGSPDGFAIDALARAGARAIPALTSLMEVPGVGRMLAIETLGNMDSSKPQVWPILINAFKETSGWAATANQTGLFEIAYDLRRAGPGVIPLLRKALKDNDPKIRAGAAATLAQMGDLAREYSTNKNGLPRGTVLVSMADLAQAAPELKVAMNDPDWDVRHQAALALAYADPGDSRAVPSIVDLVENGDFILSIAAIAALDNMGNNAKDAVPALQKVLASSSDETLRGAAARTLGKVGGTAACTSLAQAMANDKECTPRFAASQAMAQLWTVCPQAISALIGTLGESGCTGENLLARIGNPAVPALIAALKSPDLYVREGAAQAFLEMKSLTPEAVNALTIALRDKSVNVSSKAADALYAVGAMPKEVGAERDREADINAQSSELDTRSYSKQQISSPIPADADHKYPLTLSYLFPVSPADSAENPEFLITLYKGRERAERLVFWKKVGNDQYQQVDFNGPEDFEDQNFDEPTSFVATVHVPGGKDESQMFVDVPITGWRSYEDQVFAVDDNGFHPVEIESAQDWYQPKLKPDEDVRRPAGNSFSAGKLEWGLMIWGGYDPECCPTAGQVVGTYKIIKETQSAKTSSGTPESETTWKMVIDTARREPLPAS
jgi:HEAT repeat protein